MPLGRLPIARGNGCLLVLLASVAVLQSQPRLQQARAATKTITVNGQARAYLVAEPAQRSLAIPIVIAFHGTGGSGERVARVTRLHTSPFIRTALVVYPEGLDQRWNHADDVLFVKALIDELVKADKDLDRTRVFAMGIHSGGAFAMRLGCELNDKIAAVASIGGGLPAALQKSCKPTDPLPVLYFHGDNVPGDNDATPILKPAETFVFWRAANGCKTDPVIEDRVGDTPAKVNISKNCREASEVRWIQAGVMKQGWQAETAKEIAVFFSRFRRTPRF
jgi:polyhydroxybutyrate depolymerase